MTKVDSGLDNLVLVPTSTMSENGRRYHRILLHHAGKRQPQQQQRLTMAVAVATLEAAARKTTAHQ